MDGYTKLIEKDIELGRGFYKLFDDKHDDRCKYGVTPIKYDEIDTYNPMGYGIFKTPNIFKGARKKENCIRVASWAVDLDGGDKVAQMQRIKNLKITPSEIIETKNGYHVYYDAIDAHAANYSTIVGRYLVPILGADHKCKDVTRILRMQYTWHCKQKPFFMVKPVSMSGSKYTENNFLCLLKQHYTPPKVTPRKKVYYTANTTADRIANGLEKAYKRGPNSYNACCPSHPDKNPSLSIDEKNGKILVYCHSKCEQSQVVEKLKGMGLWD